MFTKEEIKTRLKEYRHSQELNGSLPIDAELDLALLILTTALFGKKLRSGEDFSAHPLAVATSYTRSKNKKVIAILHDVVEDSKGDNKWELSDLKDVGFSKRIIQGVDGVTKRPDEKYFDFIVRCGQSGDDAIDCKINDVSHNSDGSRYRHIDDSHKRLMKEKAYNIAYHYLVDLKKFKEDGVTHYNYPGTSMLDYIKSRKQFVDQPAMVNELMDMFSTETERLPLPEIRFPFAPLKPRII